MYTEIFSDKNVIGFLLLFFRFGSLFMFTPIFSHTTIPESIKAALGLFFTIIFYPSIHIATFNIDIATISIAILSEILFGLSIGLVLQIAFNAITFAGSLISFVMGFSMASAFDPSSGVSSPIISQFLSLIALMILLSLDMHHWVLLFIDNSLQHIPLGGFLVNDNFLLYIFKATAYMFSIGFVIAFPIIALSWLSDVIFGMLMKTMPQFNLLVVGYPIKIAVSIVVLIATLSATILIFKTQMQEAFNYLESFF